ncbi:hypothetical protein EVAR_8595_1 [Eumeta japonica]|uniref:Uncharacterized protein n=1 Tax=Eumeta variegata TaxID=151549 RepID=A0A4C1XIY0_EUMVA|nr:hypothetical protein EVAR_8595_1 [Eumeta japonica]
MKHPPLGRKPITVLINIVLWGALRALKKSLLNRSNSKSTVMCEPLHQLNCWVLAVWHRLAALGLSTW